MPVSIEELWMLIGERDTIIYQQTKEIRELQKQLALKEKENGELRTLSGQSNDGNDSGKGTS